MTEERPVGFRRPEAGRRLRRGLGRWWLSWEWPAVAVLYATGFALGAIGYYRYFSQETGWQRPILDSLYHSLQLTVFQFTILPRPLHWTLHVARFLLPVVAGYTAVKALVALYSEQLQNVRIRLFVRNHVVVCGLGQRGLVLVKALAERGERVVVVERDAENDLVRTAREAGAIVLVGDATERHVLRKAGVGRARAVVGLCQGDGMNAEIAVKAQQVARARGREPDCSCHVDGFRLRELIEKYRTGSAPGGVTKVRFFSIYESGAEVLLRLDPPFDGLALGAQPHVLVAGIGRMGESLVVQLARLWQARRDANGVRLLVTMLDRAALGKRDFLLAEHPELAAVWQLETATAEIVSLDFQSGSFLSEAAWAGLARAYVCFDDDGLGLGAALRLDSLLARRGRRIPIVLRTKERHGLAVLLPSVGSQGCPHDCVKVFPLLEHTCTPEATMGSAKG